MPSIPRDRASQLIQDGKPHHSCCGRAVGDEHIPECVNHQPARPDIECPSCRMVGFHAKSCPDRTVTAENPSHYQHPSGVETIEINLEMTFLAGSAFKYVQRYEAKSNPPEDLRKARWYVNLLTEKEDSIWIDADSHARAEPLLRRMLDFEENPYRIKFYQAVLDLDVTLMAEAVDDARASLQ